MLLADANYYEIFLLSLMWLSEDDEEQARPRSVSPTLHTLREINVINDKQCKAAMRSQRLRNLFLKEIDICRARVGYTHKEVLALSIQQSSRHLALPLPTENLFERRRVIDRNGYQFVLTASGLSFAKIKVDPYKSIVTRAQFLQGHAAMVQRLTRVMRSINSRNNIDDEHAGTNLQDI